MVIQHNLSALNTGNQWKTVTGKLGKSSEKLSSGYRINRAADDSAGLSISEKMRCQIRGLEKADNNIEDGISMLQLADGALSQTHAVLQRIRELAVQAANDTNTAADRQAIQDEVIQLANQVDDIAYYTDFNKAIYPLLGGQNIGDGLIPDSNYASVLDRYAFLQDDVTGQKTGGIGMYIPGMNSYAGSIGGYGNNGHALLSLTLGDGTKLKPINMFSGDFTDGTITGKRTVTKDKMTFEYEDTSNGVHFTIDITCQMVEEKDVDAMRGGQYFLSSFEITNLGTYFQSMDILLHTDPINGYMSGSPSYNGTNLGNKSIGEKLNPGDESSFICNPGSYSAFTNCDVTAKLTSDYIVDPPDVAYAGKDFQQDSLYDQANIDFMRDIYNGKPPPTPTSSDYHFGAAWIDRSLNTGASFTASTMFGLSYPLTYTGGGTTPTPDGIWIQSGFRGGDGIKIPLVDATAATLKIKKPYPDVTSHEKASVAIELLDKAIETVSGYRSDFGGYQNALSHTKSNVNNTVENTQSAESRIRDADIPLEMVEYSKNQILSKSAEAILSQANQNLASVLELLK